MTIKSFIAGLTCQKKLNINKAGCLEQNGELNWLSNVIGENYLPKWLQAAVDGNEWESELSEVVSKIDPEWYSGVVEHESAKERYMEQIGRMVRYFAFSGLAPEKWYERFSLNLGSMSISDHTDITALDKDGKRHIIRINLFNKPEASARARIERNMPKFQLDLIIPACVFGTENVYETWFLKGKNDKAGTYPAFEEKPNTNIISADYAGCDMAEIFKKGVSIGTQLCNEAECDKCYCKDVCRGYNATPVGDLDDSVTTSMSEVQLTPQQKEVTEWKEGSLSVVAGPGSGKTRVLIERLINLVNAGVNPSNILCLSHTRKAVEEMVMRTSGALDMEKDDPNMPWIMTINGLGYNILRENEKLLGRSLKLASDGETKKFLEQVLNDPTVPRIAGINYLYLRFGDYSSLDKVFKWVCDYQEHGEEAFAVMYPNADIKSIAYVVGVIDNMFEQNGYIRYDQQISLVVDLLEKHPELAEAYSKVYKYIMVDEFQDVNTPQARMIELLAVHGNLVCVGDDDQSIYRFRGGDVKHMIDFSNRNKTVILDTNFRTNDKLADLANLVISWNHNRIPKVIKAIRKAPNKPVLLRNPDDEKVAGYIQSLCKYYKPGNIAVIARDNKSLEKMGNLLTKLGVAHSASKDYLKDTKVFNVLRDILRVHKEGPVGASESFSRLYLSMYDFPAEEADFDESFHDMLVRTGNILSCEDTLQNAKDWKDCTLPTAEFGQKVTKSYHLINYFENVPELIQGLFDVWFEGTGNELEVLRTMLDMFEEGRVNTPERALALMDTLLDYKDKARVDLDYGSEFVRLLTAHDSKGKEFDAVVVLNSDEFVKSDFEEDVCVLYVAITRARHTLMLATSGGENEANFIAKVAPAVNQI